MAKRKAKKHQPKTVARQRAVVTQQNYNGANKPPLYVADITPDSSRAALINRMVQTDAFQVACQIAGAAGHQSPDLTDISVRRQWLDTLQADYRILQQDGVLAFVRRKDTDAIGLQWGEQVDYLIQEDIRRYRNWHNNEVYELKLEHGRHCNTCRRTHYPSSVRVGLFYGKDRNVSGLTAAVPAGYKITTLGKKS